MSDKIGIPANTINLHVNGRFLVRRDMRTTSQVDETRDPVNRKNLRAQQAHAYKEMAERTEAIKTKASVKPDVKPAKGKAYVSP